ncbi:MAG: putative HD phosphohydrolase [Gammaproteobacteria bacterium]
MSRQVPRWTGEPDSFVDELFAWITACGGSRYDAAVTQLEHGLQTADNAARDGAPDAEVAAALLHDVGHFLVGEDQAQNAFLAQDLRHEQVGAHWLATFLPFDVTEPIRLHVTAKRYLCAVDASYWRGLSSSSRQSLVVQGGPMSTEEQRVFDTLPAAKAALALRRRDDLGKVRGRVVPPLDSYCDSVRLLLKSRMS